MFIIMDGSALISTHFYGTIDNSIINAKSIEEKNRLCEKYLKKDKKGRYINGIESMLSYILTIARKYQPEYMAICFDESNNVFRKRLYDAYKGTRQEKPEALKEQIKNIKLILKNVGFPVFASNEYEADDIAGSIAKHFSNPLEEMILMTKDHDWLQLVNDDVNAWMIMQNSDITESMRNKYDYIKCNSVCDSSLPNKIVCFDSKVVFENEGVTPYQIPDLKGLMGDKSDNIPGITGIGSNTATKLLRYFGTIENIYDFIESHDESELKDVVKLCGISRNPYKKIANSKKEALLSKQLATIYTDVPISFNLSDYRWNIDDDMLTRAKKSFSLFEDNIYVNF